MTKDEARSAVMGAISMALKDPVLQQGFEIICKENAELKKEVEKHKWNDIFLEESAFYDKKIAEEYTTLQERIAELEKENTELKTVKIPQLERRIASIRGTHSVDCKKLNARTEQVERLKKENIELKEKNKALELYADLANGKVCEVKLMLYKAKAVITALLNVFVYDLADDELDSGDIDVRDKAERFLKEEVLK